MKPVEYRKAARRLARLAGRVIDTAVADTARQRAARTRVVNLLAQEARRLFERNAAAPQGAQR
ncbi:MAG: hypothetical protein LW854_14995 [Rubrivivax sp.]|jgi:hypothetical protein|nr:hypothetical protein [Rubrivivax sp.]